MNGLSREYSAYMTEVERFITDEKETFPALNVLKQRLDSVHREYGADVESVDGGEIVGGVFRDEE